MQIAYGTRPARATDPPPPLAGHATSTDATKGNRTVIHATFPAAAALEAAAEGDPTAA